MPIDYTRLKAEIQSNAALAEPREAGQHWRVAELLNRVDPGLTIARSSASGVEILEAIAPGDWNLITPVNRDFLQLVVLSPRLSINHLNIQGLLDSIIPLVATASRANIAALRERPASKAEVLFGEGTVVSPDDVSIALRE